MRAIFADGAALLAALGVVEPDFFGFFEDVSAIDAELMSLSNDASDEETERLIAEEAAAMENMFFVC